MNSFINFRFLDLANKLTDWINNQELFILRSNTHIQTKQYNSLLIIQIYYIIDILFEMLSDVDKYRQIIQNATRRIMLFPNADNKQNKSTIKFQRNIKLPLLHPFRSSQQIESNIPITHHITHQLSQQYTTISLDNNWPKSCIGFVLCEYHQNNQTYYVYGTGILIHEKIVLTSAQNVYCRRLNRQYTNIRFLVGVCGNQCSGIYDVMRVHYPKEYTMQEYENYNFAVLQLYDDLSVSCGYAGFKTLYNIEEDEKYIIYGYINGYQQGSFNLKSQTKNGKQSWVNKNIGAQGCKYLTPTNWTQLTTIYLIQNNIGVQGCKYLSQVNWIHLNMIILSYNNICAQGCKYLSQTNWTHLTTIYLSNNNINAQGCKYLGQANWTHLTTIYLSGNKIDAQGCKYLSQANWTHLTTIYLIQNNIGVQGCKYLIQTNWKQLITIDLNTNNIDDIIYKLLLRQSYPITTTIDI